MLGCRLSQRPARSDRKSIIRPARALRQYGGIFEIIRNRDRPNLPASVGAPFKTRVIGIRRTGFHHMQERKLVFVSRKSDTAHVDDRPAVRQLFRSEYMAVPAKNIIMIDARKFARKLRGTF